jgi:hypothetical protein
MLKSLRKHIRTARERLFPYLGQFVVRRYDEEPTPLKTGIVYLIGEKGHEWTTSFICPCGCRQIIRLNLLPHEDRPTWKIHADWQKRATITPSVWRHVGCRSHFTMKKGRVRMV